MLSILHKNWIVFLLLSCFLSTSNYNFFSQNWAWTTSGGGPKSDKANAIVTDNEGYSYITGYYNEEAIFGTYSFPLVNEHSKEVFIAKVDPNGNYVWVKNGLNYYDDRGLGICLDPQGNVYVTGTCWGGIEFGSLYETNGSGFTDQIFLVKLDNDGNFIWLKNVGNDAGDDHGLNLASDKEGNIYLTGFVSAWSFGCSGPGVATFGGLSINLGACDSLAFIAKITNDGNWQWVRSFPGIVGENDNRIEVDTASNVYVVGGFMGTKTFGTTTLTSYGGQDIYVVKYDKDGNFIYAKSTGSPLDDRANDLCIDNKNYLYICGEFRDRLDFGGDSLNNNGGPNGRDIFVAKMTPQGNWIWASKAGSNYGTDKACGITVNSNYNVFVTGQFKGDAYFSDDIPLTSPFPDSVQIFVAAIDSSGVWKWAVQAGGTDDDDRGNGIDCDAHCNIYVCGFFTGTGTFGTYTENGQMKEAFFGRFSSVCFENEQIEEPEEPIIYPPPTAEIIDSSFYMFIPNAFSPNDDELNQTFKPIITTSLRFVNYSLTVYDRWGELLFESHNPDVGWDGTFNTTQLQSGVYTWKLSYSNDLNQEKKSGFVYLKK
ncbi:MAG: gliding motility-associated C-terminal domain-containing protein [Flavobacteriia bacterium]|nr:gliding motility-associated C-terminal domain-containing protein [Flavobacteriia bacterium]